MHGVYASHYINSVFARKLQIRYSHPRDSGEIVKPFSQVDNKSTMDFATLGPSGYSRRLLELIDLPFLQTHHFTLQHRAGFRSYTSALRISSLLCF